MSLLTVAQTVAEEVGLTAPSSVIGNSDKTAKQLLRLINRTGSLLAKKNWTVLQLEHTFSTVNGTAAYSLPTGFDRFLDETLWDRSSYWSLRGPLSPRDWQVYKSGLVATNTVRSRFRVKPDTRVNKFYLDPTPTSALSMVFEYGSNLWVKDAANAGGKTKYEVDTDISLIDESLIELGCIWRILSRKGFAYAEEKDQFDREVDRMFAEDGGARVLNMGSMSVSESRTNVQESGFG